MGFIGNIIEKIRTVFSGTTEDSVDFANLEMWFENESADLLDKITDKGLSSLEKMKEERENLKEFAVEIKDADLSQLKVPENARQMISDNRKNYLRGMQDFINALDTDPVEGSGMKPSQKMSMMKKKQRNNEKAIETVNQVTAKQFYVLNQFYGEVMKKIGRALNEIHERNLGLGALFSDNQEYISYIKVKSRILRLKEDKKTLLHIQEELVKTVNQASVCEVNREKVENDIKKFYSNPTYLGMKKDKEKLEYINSQMKQIDAQLADRMGILEKAFKKYTRITLEPQKQKLAEAYLDDRLKALSGDFKLEILNVLVDIGELCRQDKLDIDKDKSEKIITAIHNIDSEFLTRIIKTYNDLSKQKNHIEAGLKNEFISRELKELQYKVEHVKERKKLLEDKIEKLKSQHSSIDLEKSKRELIEDIKDLLRVELKIVNGSASTQQENENEPKEPSEVQN